MKLRLLRILVLICFLTGCAGQTVPQTEQAYNIDTDPLPYSEETLYSMLFDLENKITLRLDMDETELTKLQEDYETYAKMGSKSPIYRKGDLHITVTAPDGQATRFLIEEVGVRMKGNTSRTDFYSPTDGIYNIIHLKLSFQETFDKEEYYGTDAETWDEDARKLRKNRTFATLEKLDLRWNRCDDGTYLKEYFAFETYRQYGVPAPHTNLASFDWAGNHMGVFTINEPVDSVFLEKNYPTDAAQGDLYKCGWAGYQNASFTDTGSIGKEDEDKAEFYAYDLKTNKKTSDHSRLISFIQAMNSADMTKERFAELVDIESYLAFSAVSYLLGNPDDMRNNYNNFYIYFRSDNVKAVFIPYDYDRCLGITAHWNPTQTGVTDDDPFTLRRLSADRGNDGPDSVQQNPVILYSVAEGGYYMEEYARTITEIVSGDWFCLETFEELYGIAEANYSGLTVPSKKFDNTSGLHLSFDLHRTSDFSSNGNISMAEYLAAKRNTLESALANMDTYMQNEPQITPTWYIRADFTDWQNHDAYVLSENSGIWSIRISLRKESALKVYNSKTDAWYGSECIPDHCTVEYSTDGYTNIVLEAGTYRILINPITTEITLEKE